MAGLECCESIVTTPRTPLCRDKDDFNGASLRDLWPNGNASWDAWITYPPTFPRHLSSNEIKRVMRSTFVTYS